MPILETLRNTTWNQDPTRANTSPPRRVLLTEIATEVAFGQRRVLNLLLIALLGILEVIAGIVLCYKVAF